MEATAEYQDRLGTQMRRMFGKSCSTKNKLDFAHSNQPDISTQALTGLACMLGKRLRWSRLRICNCSRSRPHFPPRIDAVDSYTTDLTYWQDM